jgi:myo-inositol-1-phosphate synthase
LANQDSVQIAPAEGKLGVLIPGMGAVTTTFIAGLEAFKLGLGKPIGSLTQLGTVRLGKRTEGRSPAIKDFVPLAKMSDIEVACWDIFEDNAYEAATRAGVLDTSLLEKVKAPLSAIKPMKAVFDQKFVKRINGPNIKATGSKMDHAEMVMDDIRQFQKRTGVARTTMIWCGSTEVYH